MKVEESAPPSTASPTLSKTERSRVAGRRGRIWIDLDNSPHVPLFAPIIEELERRNYSVVVTARDCFQVRELDELFRLNYKLIGQISGMNKISKIERLYIRDLRMLFLT